MGNLGIDLRIGTPSTKAEWQAYFAVRHTVLRAPLGMPIGSEKDSLDEKGSASQHVALFVQGDLVAVGRLDMLGDGIGQVRYMAVLCAHRGLGAGSKVLAELERKAEELGLIQIVLNAREKAVRFYEAAGYESTANLGNLIANIPHYKMEKRLT